MKLLVCIMIHILSCIILIQYYVHMYMYTTHAINVTNRNIYIAKYIYTCIIILIVYTVHTCVLYVYTVHTHARSIHRKIHLHYDGQGLAPVDLVHAEAHLDLV